NPDLEFHRLDGTDTLPLAYEVRPAIRRGRHSFRPNNVRAWLGRRSSPAPGCPYPPVPGYRDSDCGLTAHSVAQRPSVGNRPTPDSDWSLASRGRHGDDRLARRV